MGQAIETTHPQRRANQGLLSSGLLAALVAFSFVFSISMLFVIGSPIRHDIFGFLVSLIKAPFLDPSAASVLYAPPAILLYIATILFQPFVIIAVFTIIEIWLVGQPKSWSATNRSLIYRSAQVMLLAALGYVVSSTVTFVFFEPLFNISAMEGGTFLRVTTTAAVILLAMIVNDFAKYWAHRFEHRLKFLWRFHSVHHSIENLDAANSYAHPLDGLVGIICVGFVGSIFGFSYDEFLVIVAIRQFHEYLVHTRAPIHFGRLREWIVDNRYHHFHHSRHFNHYNHNFSEYFTIWDRVFGTCYIPDDDEMVETGVEGTKQAASLWQYVTGGLERTGEDLISPERR